VRPARAFAASPTIPVALLIAAVGDISGYGLTVRGKVGLQSRSGRVYVAAGRSYVDVDLRF